MHISEDTHVGALIKTTLVDYPGRVACSLFLVGCNLRCPYCYNRALVFNQEPPENLVTAQEVIAHLEKRKNVLSGFVVSGGEALLHPATKDLIKAAKKLGYHVKLDTNGTLPDKLEALLSSAETTPDFIAMDIKTSPERYGELIGGSPRLDYPHLLNKTIALIAEHYSTNCREWRTVLVPPLVQNTDIEAIAAILPPDATWQFAQFRNENCLNPSYNDITPYTETEVQALISHAKALVPGAALR
ncbi:MAG: anaerobic ribonucleoside-triphosphate reductase activating protein [Treponema sp.]|nr:anaerobic ribonucleoside-triphosphate reductase activating protein [Treponema sp.]